MKSSNLFQAQETFMNEKSETEMVKKNVNTDLQKTSEHIKKIQPQKSNLRSASGATGLECRPVGN